VERLLRVVQLTKVAFVKLHEDSFVLVYNFKIVIFEGLLAAYGVVVEILTEVGKVLFQVEFLAFRLLLWRTSRNSHLHPLVWRFTRIPYIWQDLPSSFVSL
jgi:hypothetical protein